MEYKGYVGNIEFSETDSIFYGKVQGIRSLISYEGENAKDLIKDFHMAVDDYLQLCAERGTEPEKMNFPVHEITIDRTLHSLDFPRI